MTMRRSCLCVLLGLAALIVPDVVWCNGSTVENEGPSPNPACYYVRRDTGDLHLTCRSNGLMIPDDFDVARIRKDVQTLSIGGNSYDAFLSSSAPPLPADLLALQHVELAYFVIERNSSMVIKRFLNNVKGRLHSLSVFDSKVTSLDDGFLQDSRSCGSWISPRIISRSSARPPSNGRPPGRRSISGWGETDWRAWTGPFSSRLPAASVIWSWTIRIRD
ncbi:uncharacterized protein LOC129590986 [Paramacrobiotus metropolitanus]|uniref:uncharacterized protein LOC129590986 n=1 Tax=Paramacrobiotus metropolitanus TaxID=2943436 RepID=UPI002445E608|nr:uncharacterized protein LOC129590986 [Paramacrobiotus metropolitanus]